MSQRLTNILGYLTLFAMLGAIWVLFGEDPTREQGGRGEPTFEGVVTRIDDVDVVKLGQGEAHVTLARDGKAWAVHERGGFPADREKVLAFLRGVALSERREPKTANHDRFDQIGLGKDALKVAFEDAREGEILRFDMGKRSAIGEDRSLTYVWHTSDTRSWLVTGLAEASADPAWWLDKALLDIAQKRVQHVRLGKLMLERALGANDFSLMGLKADEAAVPAWRLGEPARIISGLDIEDVQKLGNPLTDPKQTVELATFDGLVLTLRLHDMAGAIWAQVEAAYSDDLREEGEAGVLPDAPEDGAAEAAAINDRTHGWFFKLRDADAATLMQARDAFIEKADGAEG